ncbi:MAG: phosphoribosylaminoimidazole carboxylase [Gracilibacter sp. BRH_c7a]|nr:MAG: phosphoribosylaminoimidazole carboxylase [Gracilibacter sp. BRH_c7a]
MIYNNKNTLQPPAKIGIVGGGQLGKMMAAEAKRMGYYVAVLDPTPASPASQVVDHQIIASFSDQQAIRKLAEQTDVITFEFEHIDADILCDLESEGYNVCPSGTTLKKIKNKYIQKSLLAEAGLPVPEFSKVDSLEDLEHKIEEFGLPIMLKACYGGYDGKGNYLIKHKEDIKTAYNLLQKNELMLEKFVDFKTELSIMVGSDLQGNIRYFPVAENTHEENILKITRVPASIDQDIVEKIQAITEKTLAVLDDAGVYCIEMFLGKNREIYINEIAPRPHNSGHYTIEACVTSQYEQLIRIITGMPLGSTKLLSPCVMVNILGDSKVDGPYTFEGIEKVLAEEETYLHLYGKHATTKMKKVGHLTVLNASVDEAERIALEALTKIKFKPLKEIKK